MLSARDRMSARPTTENEMGKRDPRIDTYIANSADFARPILTHLREVVHAACPTVEETMKWNFPHFMYEGILCSMASFKQHCAFGFWNRTLVVGEHDGGTGEAMGQFGRITTLADLPSKTIITGYIKKAMRLNESGVTPLARRKPATKVSKAVAIPDDLESALRKNKAAQAAFAAFSPSAKREYVEWLTEAKRDETRKRRLATAIEWIAEGKQRNWKYMKC